MKRFLLLTAVSAALVAAAPALAGITIFKTSFQTRDAYKSMHKLRGSADKCKRQWRKKSSLGVTVKGGRRSCVVATPVHGDGKQPDHFVDVVAKMTRRTDKSVAKKTYVGVAVRASRKKGYELRVFPRTKRWRLLKNGAVLERGRSKDVAGGRRENRLRLVAKRETVIARVNKKRLAKVHDQKAGEVGGRGTGLAYGIRRKSNGTAKAFFDKLKVGIP